MGEARSSHEETRSDKRYCLGNLEEIDHLRDLIMNDLYGNWTQY